MAAVFLMPILLIRFENPTCLDAIFGNVFDFSDSLTGLLFTFGEMCKDKKQGYAVLASMLLLLFDAGGLLCF